MRPLTMGVARIGLVAPLLLFASAGHVQAATTLIDFEQFQDGYNLNGINLGGVTLTNPSGKVEIYDNSFGVGYHSGTKAIASANGLLSVNPLVGVFDVPVSYVGLWGGDAGTYIEPDSWELLAYNARSGGSLVGRVASGTWNGSPYRQLSISGTNILRFEAVWTGPQFGIGYDDLKFVTIPPPLLFGVLVGVNDYYGGVTTLPPAIAGQDDAYGLRNRLKQFAMYGRIEVLPFNYDSTSIDDALQVHTAINSFEASNKAGDVFIFMFSGHGDGDLVWTDGRVIHTDEGIWMNHDGTSNGISDDDLTSWFNNECWHDVNKLFILSSCHSGGFGRSQDEQEGGFEDDLMALPHTAIIASCGESEKSGVYGPLDGLRPGRSPLIVDIEESLKIVDGFASADTDKNGLTFAELVASLEHGITQSRYYDGYIQDHPVDDDDLVVQQFERSLFTWQSADFSMESLVVPEPSMSVLVGTGVLALLTWRVQRRRRAGFNLQETPEAVLAARAAGAGSCSGARCG